MTTQTTLVGSELLATLSPHSAMGRFRKTMLASLRLMPDSAADDVHHGFDERQFLEEFVVGNRLHFPDFLEQLDEHDGYGQAQQGRDQEDHQKVRHKMHFERSDDDFGSEHGTEPSSGHGSQKRTRGVDAIAHRDGAGSLFARHQIIDRVL
jgi:hypothetical protein